MKIPLFFILGMSLLLSDAWAMARRPSEPPVTASQPAAPLEPLTLDKAYELARTRSEVLAARQVDIELSWADFLEASGDFIGDLDFQMLHSRQKDFGGNSADSGATQTLTRSTRRTRQWVFTQPIFQGFRSTGVVAGSSSLRKQRIAEKRRAEHVLFLDVATSYYSLLRLEHDIAITRDILGLFEKRAGELSEREGIGKSRVSEVATARARQKQIEATLAQEEGAWRVELRVLEFLTGIPLEGRTLVDIPEFLAPAPESSMQNYLEYAEPRPDVEAAYQAYKTAGRKVIVAQSELWPDITLDGNLYERREGFQDGIDWDVLFTVNVPIVKGGTTFGEIKRALSVKKQAELRYREALRFARMEIQQAYDAWQSSWKEYRALQEAVKADNENYEFQKQDYEHNLVDNLDVLEALEFLNNSRLNANEAAFEYKLNYWRLQIAAGNCCENR